VVVVTIMMVVGKATSTLVRDDQSLGHSLVSRRPSSLVTLTRQRAFVHSHHNGSTVSLIETAQRATEEAGMTRRWIGATMAAATIPLSTLLTATAAHSDDAVETVVLVRHGEKPDKGLGQLNCKGLNRALALPSVIAKVFGKPDAIFAPNPSEQKIDAGTPYDYVRPLATIEPTAISFGLPVHASLGVSDTDGLRAAFEQPLYRHALILVAWEHKRIETIARGLLADYGGDQALVPRWDGDDFDSIYVVTIANAKATFVVKHEGLDGQPDTCPH
jgi:hypothetical protein